VLESVQTCERENTLTNPFLLIKEAEVKRQMTKLILRDKCTGFTKEPYLCIVMDRPNGNQIAFIPFSQIVACGNVISLLDCNEASVASILAYETISDERTKN
jgi:hypothetical protein